MGFGNEKTKLHLLFKKFLRTPKGKTCDIQQEHLKNQPPLGKPISLFCPSCLKPFITGNMKVHGSFHDTIMSECHYICVAFPSCSHDMMRVEDSAFQLPILQTQYCTSVLEQNVWIAVQ